MVGDRQPQSRDAARGRDSLQARLQTQLQRAPEQRALCFLGREGEPSWRTLAEVHGQAGHYADRLAEHGVVAGSRCILVLPSDESSATAVLATLLLGAVPLLVAPPLLQSGRHSSLLTILHGVIRKVEPTVVICAPAMAPFGHELRKAHDGTQFLFEVDPAPVPGVARSGVASGGELAGLQLTSGTTGSPRVCVWSQQSVLAALDGMAVAMKLREDDVCFNWTPLYHDMGLVNNFLLCLAQGVPLAMLSPQEFVKDPALWLRGLQATGSTVTWSPNFGFALTTRKVLQTDGLSLGHVRSFWNAAERVHWKTMLEFHQRFKPFGLRKESLKTNFGCAENVGGATFSDPDGEVVVERVDRTQFQQSGIAVPTTGDEDPHRDLVVVGVGRPYPGLSIEILSSDGDLLPDGQIGEIALRTPSSMSGYLDQPQESDRALVDGRLLTGDLGYLRGDELFWTGRLQERINVRGKKIDPSDFESVLLQIEGLRVGCFAVFGVDDSEQGTQRIVVVSEVLAVATGDPGEIMDSLRTRVYEELGVVIDEVLLLAERTMTKTSSGKRRHRYYRQLYLSGQLTSLHTAGARQSSTGEIGPSRG